MNLFKRLKNLWLLSEWEPLPVEKEKIMQQVPGTRLSFITAPPKKMATIVEDKPELFPNQEEEL